MFATVMHVRHPLYPDTIIDFHETETNIGNGMDSSTGIFTAPVSGTYFFSFSGRIEPYSGEPTISLRVCQNNESKIIDLYYDLPDKDTAYSTADFDTNYNWSMYLDQNDEIYLKSHDRVEGPCRFFGQLVMIK